MRTTTRTLLAAGALLLVLGAAAALPKEEDAGNKEVRSPAIDDFSPYQDEDQPAEFSLGSFFMGRVGKFFNDFLQFPATVFRFVSGIIANQPFAKLREEVRNLNISYPK